MSRRETHAHLRAYTEPQARQLVLERLHDHFVFYEEVTAVDNATGDGYRFDAISVDEGHGYILGWEFKTSYLLKAEFVSALRQAINYRHAVIQDPRFPGLQGKAVSACIVCPDWNGLHESGRIDYAKEADGMRLLASQFRVGVLRENEAKDKLAIVIGEQAVWHSKSGWTKNAAGVLVGKRTKGSTRKLERNLA